MESHVTEQTSRNVRVRHETGTAEKAKKGYWGVWPEEYSSCFRATLEQSGKLWGIQSNVTEQCSHEKRRGRTTSALKPFQLKHVVILHRVFVSSTLGVKLLTTPHNPQHANWASLKI